MKTCLAPGSRSCAFLMAPLRPGTGRPIRQRQNRANAIHDEDDSRSFISPIAETFSATHPAASLGDAHAEQTTTSSSSVSSGRAKTQDQTATHPDPPSLLLQTAPRGISISRQLPSLSGLASRPPSPLPPWPSPRGPPSRSAPAASNDGGDSDESSDPSSSPTLPLRPYMLYLPDLDGSGMTAERSLPCLADIFDLQRLTIEADHAGGFTELADYVAVGGTCRGRWDTTTVGQSEAAGDKGGTESVLNQRSSCA